MEGYKGYKWVTLYKGYTSKYAKEGMFKHEFYIYESGQRELKNIETCNVYCKSSFLQSNNQSRYFKERESLIFFYV